MAETSVGQVQQYFNAMSTYFGSIGSNNQDPTQPMPNFMEVIPTFNFTELINESQRLAKGNPTMVSGALIEAASSMFAALRESGMRAKIRSDFFSEAGGAASQDSDFYSNQGQTLVSFINGKNDMQS